MGIDDQHVLSMCGFGIAISLMGILSFGGGYHFGGITFGLLFPATNIG